MSQQRNLFFKIFFFESEGELFHDFWTKIKKENVIFFISNERKRRITEGFVF